MANNNEERLKKLIEEKKKLNDKNSANTERAAKKVGNAHRAFNNTKRGGFFDK